MSHLFVYVHNHHQPGTWPAHCSLILPKPKCIAWVTPENLGSSQIKITFIGRFITIPISWMIPIYRVVQAPMQAGGLPIFSCFIGWHSSCGRTSTSNWGDPYHAMRPSSADPADICRRKGLPVPAELPDICILHIIRQTHLAMQKASAHLGVAPAANGSQEWSKKSNEMLPVRLFGIKT